MKQIGFDFTRRALFPGYDGKTCKICPSLASDGKVTLLRYSHLLLTGIDVGVGAYMARSTDGGVTFEPPVRQTETPDTYENGLRRTWGGGLYYNKTHGIFFILGNSSFYANDKEPVLVNGQAITRPVFAPVDPERVQAHHPTELEVPFPFLACYPFGQAVELDGGDMLIAFNFLTEDNHKSRVVTVRYTFVGGVPKPVRCGTHVSWSSAARGVGEPSLARIGNRFFLTLRTDDVGLFAESGDGYVFSEPRPWTWEDGTPIGNYNTQQHWIVAPDGLFLAYTRRGAHNDHVFRHRAPIFMARFDEDRGVLLRDTEVILVPELGARLGNFSAFEPNEKESVLVTAEWMQSWDQKLGVCDRYGSNNSLWIANVKWK